MIPQRMCRTIDGQPKVKYKKREWAEERLGNDTTMNIYWCDLCHSFHLGHLKKVLT